MISDARQAFKRNCIQDNELEKMGQQRSAFSDHTRDLRIGPPHPLIETPIASEPVLPEPRMPRQQAPDSLRPRAFQDKLQHPAELYTFAEP